MRRDNFTYTDLNVIITNSPVCHVLFGALAEVCKVSTLPYSFHTLFSSISQNCTNFVDVFLL